MKCYVVKLSGNIFDDLDLVEKYINIFRKYVNMNYRFVVVTGGGSIARKYIEFTRKLTGNESYADLIGITVSRLNAQLLAYTLQPYAYPHIPKDIHELHNAWVSGKEIIVVGGFQPGQSTTTVTMIVAEYLGIKEVIDCANIDAVYDDDPKINPNAKKYTKIKIDELEEILRKTSRSLAGTYELLDIWSLRIAKRSNIKIYLIYVTRSIK